MSDQERIIAHLAEHPGACAVDMFLARVLPDAVGTISYLAPLRELAAEQVIVRSPGALDVWIDHVERFPGAHMVSEPLTAQQACRWHLPT